MSNALPRGLRNKNPGNLDSNPRNKWQGEIQGDDPRFCTFSSFAYGIRAMSINLMNYQRKHGLRTVRTIISRYAPGVENDTEAYIRVICKALKVGDNEVLDLTTYAVLRPLVEAIIKHENGRLAPITAPDIDAGLALAGVMPARERVPLAKSKTVIGSTIATAGTTVGAVVQQVKDTDVQHSIAAVPGDSALEAVQSAQEAVSYTLGIWQWAGIVCAVLAIVGIGIVLYSKWDRRRKGIE